jgi:intein/homing endonuclease
VENNVPIVTATQTTRGGYCVALDTLVFANNQKKKIVDVNIGDDIDSYNGKNKVLSKFPVVKKKGYKITLKSGKEIICSKDHLFPTKEGERSIKTGLIVGELLQVKSG